MMTPKIVFSNLIRQLLPSHKRQPVRLALLRLFVAPLAQLFMSFESWRRQIRIEIGMTSQVGVLEGYLRAKYEDERIRVAMVADSGLAVGLGFEGDINAASIGLPGEQSVAVPLEGEISASFGDVDFVVYYPANFTDQCADEIRRDINRFKKVLSTYKLIESN